MNISLFASIQLSAFSFTDWNFLHPHYLHGLWALPAFILIFSLSSNLTQRNRSRLADQSMRMMLIGKPGRWRSAARFLCVLLALGSGIIAIAQPRSNPHEIEVETQGRDIVILLDVSRSMLAKDVAPSRLAKAKLWINDLVDGLGNDRIGLVAFAGSSSVLSPLTTDRLFYRLALEELSPNSVPLGGTNIGDAIRKTMNLVFLDSTPENIHHRDLILISDGEDQESLPIEAARAAGKEGVRIICIGIGSTKGAAVPNDKKNTSQDRSQPVQSKLESQTLRDIAGASPGGVYLEVGTGTVDLAQVYQDLIESAEQHVVDTGTITEYTEQFMYFIGLALAFIILESVILPSISRKDSA